MTSSIAGQQLADDRSDAYSKAPGSDITTVLKEHSNSGTSTEGSEGTIQTLYEDPPKCQCCINWVEQHPEDVRMEVEQQEQTKQKALVVRMCKNHREGKALVLDSVLVQSESLKETLAQVFEGYQGITPDLKKLVFRAPFHSFYYRWENFTQILDDQKMNDPEAASYTQLLYDVLDTELRGARNDVADLLGNGVITYELLWSLFEPGERVISKIGSHSQFFVTQRSHTKEKGSFELEGKFVDWDGSKFGYSSAMLQVRPFAGTKPITQLEVFPARLCPTLENIESEAIARGKKFCDLRSFHHIAYSKTVTYRGPWGNGACNVSNLWNRFPYPSIDPVR